MADQWEVLRKECLSCRSCALADTRTQVVFGDGATDAEILLIGEGPGQNEDEQVAKVRPKINTHISKKKPCLSR